MAGHNAEPLHKRVHWRKIRKIYNSIAQHEGISLSVYNLEKIICYECLGDDLKGGNVRYNNRSNYSPWVSDNHYEIFEAPNLNNYNHNISRRISCLST